jgi:hypothetical protein
MAGNYYFNPNGFSTTRLLSLDAQAQQDASKLPCFTYGALPRNVLRGPGRANVDVALAKNFKIQEQINAGLRLDAFNVFNHTQFNNPDLTITDPTFGEISGTYPPRILTAAPHLPFGAELGAVPLSRLKPGSLRQRDNRSTTALCGLSALRCAVRTPSS